MGMGIIHKKEFGIYHCNTFDNETFLVDEADTLEAARRKVQDRYGDRISGNGADRVDIVDGEGNVVRTFAVG